uniref:Tc1-like transposase DDE domain-containing protein n=1 Tax=Bionectria ochroleuca TaxID=29856 RepID=A0A8H7N5Q7_BIOOC
MERSHHDTPKRARFKGTAEYLEAKNIPYFKTDLCSHFEIPRRTGYRILESVSTRTRHNNPGLPETRGRKRKLSEADLDRLEDFCDEEEFEATSITWEGVAIEAGLEADVCGRTLQKAAQTRQLYKRLAQQVEFKNQQEYTRRFEYAKEALYKRPKPQNWYNIYFSDEVYFGYSNKGRARIIRKPGTRSDPSNLQERKEPSEKEEKQLHAWGAIGYDFKSPLVWYEINSNSNSKITQIDYKKKILKPYIKKWLEEGRSFVLEEDNDSGHGPGKSNPVRAWKEENNLQFFFNCPKSPDLSPIENCWLVPKEYIRHYPHWDKQVLRELAEEGWRELKQSTINAWVNSMLKRLRHVIRLGGKMTGF